MNVRQLRGWGTHLAAAAVLLVATAGCTADDVPLTVAAPQPVEAVALAATPDGGYYWASLAGQVHAADGSVLATVDVELEGQRGLVGLAVDADGRLFASWVAPDLRLTVAELSDGAERVVWLGPETVQGGNGGRIVFDTDGSLLFGVGLLNDRAGQADPASVVGKVVRLDPDGDADQRPEILSGPWNNPFALTVAPNGDVWVADNHPQDGDERLARADRGLDPATVGVLPTDAAPTGLAVVGDELWVCSYNTRQLLRFTFEGSPVNPPAADDCLLDITVLTDGRVIYSTGQSIETLTP